MALKNRILKAEILRRFDTQADFAVAAHIPATRVSLILHGRVKPSRQERRAFARIFGEQATTLLNGAEPRQESESK
jgi:hypothetical protein